MGLENPDDIIKEALWQGFLKTEEEFLELSKEQNEFSGACCTVTVAFKDKVYCANLGDSRALLLRLDQWKINKVKAFPLSRDHKASLEKVRIEAAGGYVENNRVNGVLAICRSIGDRELKDPVFLKDPNAFKRLLQGKDPITGEDLVESSEYAGSASDDDDDDEEEEDPSEPEEISVEPSESEEHERSTFSPKDVKKAKKDSKTPDNLESSEDVVTPVPPKKSKKDKDDSPKESSSSKRSKKDSAEESNTATTSTEEAPAASSSKKSKKSSATPTTTEEAADAPVVAVTYSTEDKPAGKRKKRNVANLDSPSGSESQQESEPSSGSTSSSKKEKRKSATQQQQAPATQPEDHHAEVEAAKAALDSSSPAPRRKKSTKDKAKPRVKVSNPGDGLGKKTDDDDDIEVEVVDDCETDVSPTLEQQQPEAAKPASGTSPSSAPAPLKRSFSDMVASKVKKLGSKLWNKPVKILPENDPALVLRKPGVVVAAEPEMRVLTRGTDDNVIVIASDGMWDVCSNKAIARTCSKMLRRYGVDALDMVAQELVDEAHFQGSTDDITAAVIILHPLGDPDFQY